MCLPLAESMKRNTIYTNPTIRIIQEMLYVGYRSHDGS